MGLEAIPKGPHHEARGFEVALGPDRPKVGPGVLGSRLHQGPRYSGPGDPRDPEPPGPGHPTRLSRGLGTGCTQDLGTRIPGTPELLCDSVCEFCRVLDPRAQKNTQT